MAGTGDNFVQGNPPVSRSMNDVGLSLDLTLGTPSAAKEPERSVRQPTLDGAMTTKQDQPTLPSVNEVLGQVDDLNPVSVPAAENSSDLSQEKSLTIIPPYPWSMDRRAKIYTIDALLSKGITVISGNVQCKNCDRASTIEFPLVEKFTQIWNFVSNNRVEMHQRAPVKWMQSKLPMCTNCGHENSLKPIIGDKKRNINWLFLLLGEMVGCCSIHRLRYFCKHTENHRTGAKNRVLYLTYLTLCHQLNPNIPPK